MYFAQTQSYDSLKKVLCHYQRSEWTLMVKVIKSRLLFGEKDVSRVRFRNAAESTISFVSDYLSVDISLT